MADIVVDGQTRVTFATAIANINAPTTTELNAGLLITSVLTPDGLQGFEATTATVDNSALDSTFDTVTIGRDSYSGTLLQFKKQLTGDTAYSTLTRGTAGFVVIRRDLPSTTAYASTQPLEVYPVTCGQTKRITPAANEVTKFQVPVMITSSPSLRAAIA